MAKLYMLIGLPASGKSTWASNNGALVFSSDEYRARLLGSAEDQSDNSKIFGRLQYDCYEALKAGKDCIYDATNINRKDRRGFLTKVKDLPDLEKIAVIFATPLEICKKRNQNRDRVVPEYVYDKMLKKFEMPVKGEGFDKIEVVSCTEANRLTFAQQMLDQMKGFEQKNPHHTLTLLEHCNTAKTWCVKHMHEYPPKTISTENELKAWLNKNCLELTNTAALHDYGKLFTQTFDKDGIGHYYNHENVGAYKVLTDFSEPFASDVATLINYHMIPYTYDKMSDKKQEQTKKELADIWDLLQILHKADLAAH